MSQGQILRGQMSPWQLESVLNVHRNLPLKFHQNWVSNSRDNADVRFVWWWWGGVCKVILLSNPTVVLCCVGVGVLTIFCHFLISCLAAVSRMRSWKFHVYHSISLRSFQRFMNLCFINLSLTKLLRFANLWKLLKKILLLSQNIQLVIRLTAAKQPIRKWHKIQNFQLLKLEKK